MPILGGLLVSLFSGLAGFLARFLGVRAAAAAAAVATFTALTAALYGAVGVSVAALQVAFPSVVLTGVWLLVPDNAVPCVSACIGCDVLCALYRWNTGTLRLAATTG